MRRTREQESFLSLILRSHDFFTFLGLGLGLLSAGKTGPIFSWVDSYIFRVHEHEEETKKEK
jgi:hypothetical protein